MSKPSPADISKAQRKIYNTLEAGMRRSMKRIQSAIEEDDKKARRIRYNQGAAKSPTLPPRASLERDEKTLEVLSVIEDEATDGDGYILVDALAQKFLNEQDLLDPALATVPLTTFDDLVDQIHRLVASPDPKLEKALRRRLKLREQLDRQKVRIYGWDKCTYLLQSCFISWSMNPGAMVPFTVNLSKKAILGAKRSKTGFATHLQDRMRKIIKRKLGGQVPEFWFLVETGSKSGFHLHGAIACGTDPIVQDRVKSALQSFSGIDSSKAVKLSAAGQRLRWAEYCSKHSVITKKVLQSGTFACTMGCRREGKRMYEAFREEVRSCIKA